MRKVILAAAVVGCCVVLSSCGGRPEDAFLGSWKGTVGDVEIEVDFLEKDAFAVKTPDGVKAGTWSVDENGDARVVVGEEEVVGVSAGEGKIILREADGDNAVMLERVKKR
jgi:hypothetical protein